MEVGEEVTLSEAVSIISEWSVYGGTLFAVPVDFSIFCFTKWKTLVSLILIGMRICLLFIMSLFLVLMFSCCSSYHPIRTEHGLSPLQLWQRGMISASPRWQQEIAEGFYVSPDYGIHEDDHFINSFDQPRVLVPRTNINLTPHQKRQLEDQYSPFQYSDHGGIDIYVDVRNHIFDLLNM